MPECGGAREHPGTGNAESDGHAGSGKVDLLEFWMLSKEALVSFLFFFFSVRLRVFHVGWQYSGKRAVLYKCNPSVDLECS
jgi:hypothetical protein